MEKSSDLNVQSPAFSLATDDRLDSWKEIASFFRREVRTVQLWEKSEDLPIRRQSHLKKSSVYAFRPELEAWWISRSVAGTNSCSPKSVQLPARLVPATSLSSEREQEITRLLVFPFEVTHAPQESAVRRQNVDDFAQGTGGDLVLELRRVGLYPICPILRALAWPSKPTESLMRNMAAEFASEFLLSGTIRYNGTHLRVTLRLVRGTDLSCVWSERFDTTLSANGFSGFDAQASLASRMSTEIDHHLTALRMPSSSDDDSPAHHACRLGIYFWEQRRGAELVRAASYFRDAIDLDPACTDAHAGLVDTCVSLSYSHLLPPRKATATTRHVVDAAIALNPTSLKVQNAWINFLIHCVWDWPAAEQVCRQLVDSGRGDARTFQLYSSLMINLGRNEDAVRLALQARELAPLSDLIHGQLSFAYFYSGDYASALDYVRRALALQPTFVMGHALLGRVQAARGNWDEAIAAVQNGMDIAHGAPSLKALLAYGYAGIGDKAAARSILQEIEHDSPGDCFPAYDIAAVYAILHQEGRAMSHMLRAYDMRDIKTTYMRHDPRFTPLRGSVQFQKVASAIYPGAG